MGESVQTEVEDIDVVLEEADVLYVTRVQKERFASREVSYVCVRLSLSLSLSLSLCPLHARTYVHATIGGGGTCSNDRLIHALRKKVSS